MGALKKEESRIQKGKSRPDDTRQSGKDTDSGAVKRSKNKTTTTTKRKRVSRENVAKRMVRITPGEEKKKPQTIKKKRKKGDMGAKPWKFNIISPCEATLSNKSPFPPERNDPG